MNVEQARFCMVEQQIRPAGVLNPNILSFFKLLRREDFVPLAYRQLAFAQTEIPLMDGLLGSDQARMLTPTLEAQFLQAAQPARHERVLEIGTGSGWMTALLAHLTQEVITVEINSHLAQQAQENLRHAGLSRVQVITANASQLGDVDSFPQVHTAPFHLIVLSGLVPQLPTSLLPLLHPDGRICAILGEPDLAHLCTGRPDIDHAEKWKVQHLGPAQASPLHSWISTPSFVF
jgi:protein-L-isoaspartate(D-aspartate) O-methyltransferase